MSFNSRVHVQNCVGRRVFTAHRELAMSMVATGEAEYISPRSIVLTQVVRMTEEMSRPRILKFKVNRAQSSAGDAGRGLTFLPPVKTVHYPTGQERTPAFDLDGNVIGHRIAA